MTAPDGSPHHGPARPRIDHEIPARQSWSGVIRVEERMRLLDSHGQQAIDTLFYNAHDHAERYSAQDTLRCQNAAYITTGTRIMSNEGRVMLGSIKNPGQPGDCRKLYWRSIFRYPDRRSPPAPSTDKCVGPRQSVYRKPQATGQHEARLPQGFRIKRQACG